jgi:hypothetical protein
LSHQPGIDLVDIQGCGGNPLNSNVDFIWLRFGCWDVNYSQRLFDVGCCDCWVGGHVVCILSSWDRW